MRHKINLKLNDELINFINDMKLNMLDLEKENENIFGDENIYNKASKFNKLAEWEKNLVCVYVYCNSYRAMQEFLDASISNIHNIIIEIKEKLK